VNGKDEDFYWNDAESIVIPEQAALAVYTNPRGEIVIRQKRSWDREEDHFVYFDKTHVATLIDKLQALLKE